MMPVESHDYQLHANTRTALAVMSAKQRRAD
jgi:hypothetical protein